MIINNSMKEVHSRVPIILLVLAGAVMALSIFDWVALSEFPFMRTPAAVAAIMLIVIFTITRLPTMQLKKGPMRWAIGFLFLSAVIELIRVLLPASLGIGLQIAHYLQWAQPVILFLIIMALSEDSRAFKYIWGAVVVAGFFMSLMVYFKVPLFSESLGDRYGFSGINLNAQAYWYALTATTLMWFLLIQWPRIRWRQIGLIVCFFSVFLALLGTASRSGFLALIAGLSILLFAFLNKKNISVYFTLIPIIIVLAISMVLNNALVLDRLEQVTTNEEQADTRIELLEAAWPKIKQSPWIGYGPRYTAVLGEQIGRERIAAHNTYSQILMTFGIPGLFFWLAIVFSISHRVWKLRHEPVGALFLALLACTLIFSLVGDLGYRRITWVLFALAANISVLVRAQIGVTDPLYDRPFRRQNFYIKHSPRHP